MKSFALVAASVAALVIGCSKKAEAVDPAVATHEQVINDIRSGNDAPQPPNNNGQQAQNYNGQQPMNQQAPRAPGPMKPLPPGVYAMQRAQVVDQAGFAQPMVAATLLVPYGWRTEGGIVWGAYQQCGPDYANNWSMTSPDGSASMRVMPAPNWTATRTNYPIQQQQQQSACETASYTSAREYLTATAQRFFPQSRVIDYRSLPEDAKPLVDMLAQIPPINNQNMQSQMTVDAGEILVAYQDRGREMRATISTIALITQVRYADMLNPGQVGMETISGFPSQITIVTAPVGQLDFGLRKRINSSVRFTQQWSNEVAKFNAEKSRQAMASSKVAHDARMDAIKKTGEIMNGIYEDRQIASDRNQREFIESIRGVETYNDPVYGGPVQLDNTYDHAWRVNNADAYILTNDPNFNPGQYDIQAQQLKVIQ